MLKIFHGALSSSSGAIVEKLCPKQILALPTSLTLALPVELRKHAETHHNITAKAGFKGANQGTCPGNHGQGAANYQVISRYFTHSCF